MSLLQLDAMLVESDLEPTELDALLARDLDVLTEQAAPVPSAALAALFGELDAVTPLPRPARPSRRPRRTRGTVASAVVLAVATVGATGLSAAANTLPPPWQRQLSQLSHRFLPFQFPQPPEPAPAAPHARSGGTLPAHALGALPHRVVLPPQTPHAAGQRPKPEQTSVTASVPASSVPPVSHGHGGHGGHAGHADAGGTTSSATPSENASTSSTPANGQPGQTASSSGSATHQSGGQATLAVAQPVQSTPAPGEAKGHAPATSTGSSDQGNGNGNGNGKANGRGNGDVNGKANGGQGNGRGRGASDSTADTDGTVGA